VRLDAFTYAPWMVANLTLNEHPVGNGFELAWDNVLRDSASLGYVVATHQSGIDHGPTVLTYYVPLTGADPRRERQRLLDTSWSAWCDQIVADLSHAHPRLESQLQSIDVYRWGHGMIRPVPGFVWGDARRAAAVPIDGRIYFAHSDLSGLALFEEAQYRGVAAAEDVLAARGVRTERWT
jgi:hypothetical protein